MNFEALKPDLGVLLEYFGYRHEFLALEEASGRLQVAHVEGQLIPEDTLQRLKQRYPEVECRPVARAVYEKTLWDYFGERRPSQGQVSRTTVPAVTFQVAEVTPASQPKLETTLWEHCRERFTELRGVSQFYTPVLEQVSPDCNQLLVAAHLAFAEHRPLILSPDMIWLTLLQGLCEHLESHAEELRPLLVRSTQRERLVVGAPDLILESLESPWERVFAQFHELIGQQLQPAAVNLASVRFSTTGALEQAVFSIALMDTMKVYFDYEMNCICGIPEISLEGTPSDWSQLRQALAAWKQFGLDWWLDSVDPILLEFEAAASGKVNRIFWNDLFQQHDSLETGYGGPIEFFSGWIARLFPYYEGRPNPAVEKPRMLRLAGFRSSLSRASVKVQAADGASELEFVAGMLGIEQRGLALRPCLGWVVHQQRNAFIEDEQLRKLSKLRPELRAQASQHLPPPPAPPPAPRGRAKGPDCYALSMADRLSVRVSRELVPLVDPRRGGPLIQCVDKIRDQFARELGLPLPGVTFADNLRLDSESYEVLLGQRVIATAHLSPERPLPPTTVAQFSNHLTDLFRAHAAELLDYDIWCELRNRHRQARPNLYKALRSQGIGSIQIWQVLRGLLRQQVPIRDQVTILQTMLVRPGQTLMEWIEACRAELTGATPRP
ncbi:DUF4419 domain-containing protein [bacterium]|nr:DUF4419 domain-containing protein [bacterium]